MTFDPGRGLRYEAGDVVTIAEPRLGRLIEIIIPSKAAAPWTFGMSAPTRNLAGRGLVGATL